jgi:hypothetical protein
LDLDLILTGNIPASSGSNSTNSNPGLSRTENIDSHAPSTDLSRKSKKKNLPARRDTSDMDEAQRLAEAKAEELWIQAEKTLKQQEDDEREEEERRRFDNRISTNWGGVYLYTQFTPTGKDRLDLTYNDVFHSPHFLNASCSPQLVHMSHHQNTTLLLIEKYLMKFILNKN